MTRNSKPFVTLAQVARAAGVSPGAASVAVRGGAKCSIGVSEKVAARVREVAVEMGYRPSATARAMCHRATRQIGVVLPNHKHHSGTGPMTFETLNGINGGLQSAGRLMVLVRLHDVLENVERGSRVFREDALDGVIVVGAMPKETLKWIGKQFAKCLWCDTNFWSAAGCVRRDEKAAGRRTCAQILESKFSDLIWIGNDEKTSSHFSSAERLAGAEACCKAAGRGLVKMRISEFASQPARNFLGKSLLAESFPIALRLGVLLGRAKIAAGRDVSLACCDDPHETSWAWPELSRAQFDRHRMGRRAAEMMLKMLDTGTTPKSERLASGWIEGATIVKKSGSKK